MGEQDVSNVQDQRALQAFTEADDESIVLIHPLEDTSWANAGARIYIGKV